MLHYFLQEIQNQLNLFKKWLVFWDFYKMKKISIKVKLGKKVAEIMEK